MDFLSALKRQTFILALCYILTGAFFVFRPGTAAVIIIRILAMAALVIGVIKTVEFFSYQKYDKPFSNNLTGGVLILAIAVFMLAQPQVIVSILYVIIGAALIVNGIIAVQSAIDLWHFQENRTPVVLSFGTVTLILGIIVLFNPFATAEVLVLTSGIFMLIAGITDIVSLFYIRKASQGQDK